MERDRKVKKTDKLSQALKKITYGFYIVTTRKSGEEMTTRDEDYVAAGTVSWLSQGSFEPPLVTVAINKQSDLYETIEKSRVFAVNIVGKEQEDMLHAFAKDSRIEEDTINGYAFFDGPATASPILQDVPAYFECKLLQDVNIGDHSILVGEVIGGDTPDASAVPLTEWETNLHYGG